MEFTTNNGIKVKINPADFKDAIALKSAFAKEVASANFELDFKSLSENIDLAEIVKLAAAVDSSELVQEKIFKCLARCTYDGQRITEATFEDMAAREDYYQIVIECLKVNLSPFFKGLISKLSPLMAKLDQAEKLPK